MPHLKKSVSTRNTLKHIDFDSQLHKPIFISFEVKIGFFLFSSGQNRLRKPLSFGSMTFVTFCP